MGKHDDEALRRLEGDLTPAPDFEAMTDQERDEWLRSRPKHPRPASVTPIFAALILSGLWFSLLSPLVSAPWGPNLSATVIDRGQANIQSCQRNWSSLWRMWKCSATISWQGATPTDLSVLSPRRLSGTTEVVARNKVRNSRSPNVVSAFGARSVVLPADMPAYTGATMTALNLGGVLVIWTACGYWAVRRTRAEARSVTRG